MKIKPLYLMNVILAIVLLTSLLANAATNRSVTTSTSKYDPWTDINDDGVIDGQDAVMLIDAIPSTGDPTKNVNITNWPEWLEMGNVTVTNWPSWQTTGNVTVINWPSEMNVSVTSWSEGTISEEKTWFKYIGQHSLIGSILVPENLGQIGPEKMDILSVPGGYQSFNYTYYSLGKIDLSIPKKREIIAKITLSSPVSPNAHLLNLTMEFGYTDKNLYTSLAHTSWAGDEHLQVATEYGLTLELGSLSSDVRITDKYLYFKVYGLVYQTDHVYYWTRSNYNDVVFLIPEN